MKYFIGKNITFIGRFTVCTPYQSSRQSYSQNRRVLYLALFCVNQWEEDKYFILFRNWLKSKGTLPMSL
jgi:hypothetical protein